jgi:hypothetical protein
MRVLIIILAVNLTGCAAVYTGASTATFIATGKSIPEHGASIATSSDCSTWNYVFKNKDYLCEQRDPGKTYNRNGF